MPWEVKLVGDKAELGELAKAFNDGPFVVLRPTDEPNDYILTSPQFEVCEGQPQVLALANRFIELLRGADVLAQRVRPQSGIGHATFRTAAGGVDAYVNAGSLAGDANLSPVSTAVTKPSGETTTWSSVNSVRKTMTAAYSDAEIGKVLELLTKGHGDWPNLYRIYEVIDQDMKRHNQGSIVKSRWTTKQELTRFTRTANSPDAIGNASRHGYQREQPPSDPMSFEDAKELVNKIANEWLRSKIQL